MKQYKYKNGIVILKNGTEIKVKAPNRLTAEWFNKYAYHFAKVKDEDIKEVIVIG